MRTFLGSTLLIALVGVLALGCQVSPVNKQKQAQTHSKNNTAKKIIISSIKTVHACKEPRSQMCTKEYRPVCAEVDTGIRCIKAPCPSSKPVTKSNACVACADKNVLSFVEGACGVKK
jgi:hypothetical protein